MFLLVIAYQKPYQIAVPPRRLSGIYTLCPDRVFADRTYCFTGASARATRVDIFRRVKDLGGSVAQSVTAQVNFLIISAERSPVWAYSCFGRKVEQAMNLPSEGHSLALVHEHDCWDALQDA